MAPLDMLGGWQCPASGDGLEPCDGRKRPSLQSCAMGPQSPAPHPLSGSCFLVLVSLRPSLLVPCGNLGDTLPPSSALGEAPHPQGRYTHQTSQIAPCGNFVLCSDKLCVMILPTTEASEERVSFFTCQVCHAAWQQMPLGGH